VSTSGVGDGFPDILAPVTLRLDLHDDATAQVSSVVFDFEDVDGTQGVVVGRPDLSGVPDAGTFPRRGEALTLMWSRPSGQMQWGVVATAGRRSYGAVWVLTPMGAAVREQRRQYFRIPVTLPAMLAPAVDAADEKNDAQNDEPDEGAAVRATVVEISEGGAMICCDTGLPEVGSFVEVSFTLNDKPVTTTAEVLRHKSLPSGRPSAAVRFLDPAAYGDDIRRYAFDVQRARARSGLS